MVVIKMANLLVNICVNDASCGAIYPEMCVSAMSH